MIPPSLCEITKTFIFLDRPNCELNEIKSKCSLKKLYKFTSNSFRIVTTRKTRNIRSLFPLKDKNDYKSCVIYKRDCSCGSRYIGETKRNAEVRWTNITIQIKVQNHQNTCEATSITILLGLSFQMLQKMLRPRKT